MSERNGNAGEELGIYALRDPHTGKVANVISIDQRKLPVIFPGVAWVDATEFPVSPGDDWPV